MTRRRRLGLLGGTFDPVHYGHLDAAEAAGRALGLDGIRFVPAHDPPHRPVEPRTSPFHRFALAALAVNERPGWSVSDVELRRPGRSYSIDTLRGLHAEGWAASQIVFILGADAFAEIATWHGYPDLFDLAQFAVLTRPGTSLDEALARVPELRARAARAGAPDEAPGQPAILLVDAETRDISSTAIRARLARGLAIDDLVPPAVARHILAHQLYGAVDDLHDEDEGDEA
jgi:nicotinate-nucleotide adenylyltransferase